MDKHIEVKSTPAANWRQEGKTDPHNTRYECQRVDLTMGQLTDDEIANAVFLCDHRTSFDSIVYLTAAKDRIRWLSRSNEALIAQLEAAQKERDEFRLAFQQNEQAKQELFAQKDLLITANLNISRRAEKAEAELSAANEKLSKPVVLPIKYNPAVAGNKSTRANFIWHNDAISYCADAIKAAGFTVEE